MPVMLKKMRMMLKKMPLILQKMTMVVSKMKERPCLMKLMIFTQLTEIDLKDAVEMNC